jgi:hypothetical protein
MAETNDAEVSHEPDFEQPGWWWASWGESTAEAVPARRSLLARLIPFAKRCRWRPWRHHLFE